MIGNRRHFNFVLQRAVVLRNYTVSQNDFSEEIGRNDLRPMST
jgi:hypothetical protein